MTHVPPVGPPPISQRPALTYLVRIPASKRRNACHGCGAPLPTNNDRQVRYYCGPECRRRRHNGKTA